MRAIQVVKSYVQQIYDRGSYGSWKTILRVRHILTQLSQEDGQGTTEYAILVGVLVVIAIVAIVAFRGKVQDLWNAIVDGMGNL